MDRRILNRSCFDFDLVVVVPPMNQDCSRCYRWAVIFNLLLKPVRGGCDPRVAPPRPVVPAQWLFLPLRVWVKLFVLSRDNFVFVVIEKNCLPYLLQNTFGW